jgi:hypothetical protein
MISLVAFDIAFVTAKPPQLWRPVAGRWRLELAIASTKSQPSRADAPFEATHQAKARDEN